MSPDRNSLIPQLGEPQLRKLTYGLQVGIVVHGPGATILYANSRALALLGLSEAQLIGKSSFDPDWNIVHPDGRAFRGDEHPSARALSTGEPVEDVVLGVFRPTTHDRVWLLVRADPFVEDGVVTQAVVTFTDITPLVAAERARNEALRAASQLRRALDAVPAYVYQKDREGRYIYANAPTLELFKIPPETVPGIADPDVFPAAAAERLRGIDARVLRGERTIEEVEIPHADGVVRTYLEIKSPLEPIAPGGPIPGLLGISIDVTERKQMERSLRQLKDFYAALARCYETIATGSDEQTLYQDVCRVAVEVAGMQMAWVGLEDPASRTIKAVASYGDTHGYLQGIVVSTDPDDPRSHGPIGTAFRTGSAVWMDDFQTDPRSAPWHAAAKMSGWASAVAVPILRRGTVVGAFTLYATDSNRVAPEAQRLIGDLARGIGIALDRIADDQERRQAEAKLRLEGAALAAADNAIVIADREARILSINAAFTAMTGYESRDAVGREFHELLSSGQHAPEWYADVWRSVLSGRTWRGEMVNRRRDGSLYTEESSITPVRDAAGSITHFVSIKQDVTERKLLEEQFRQAQKMESVGRLAGGVAHDFNNMLSVILGHAELAVGQLDAASPVAEDLRTILHAAQRSADLTRQLLTFARKQSVSPRAIVPSEEVAGSLQLLARLLTEDISLRTVLDDAVWPVYLDPTQLDQIVANLCVNARDAILVARRDPKHNAAQDCVEIAVCNERVDSATGAYHPDALAGDYVVLRVRDTGCGMAPAVRSRIFEPFFTTKGPGEGTGLGLATVFGAVKQNGGFIDVETAVGEGTTFAVYLPRHYGPPERERATAQEDMPRGSETILVVEDDPSVLHFATKVLERLGYRVLSCQGPELALHEAQTRPGEIDLLLTDIIMPGMNGRELADAIERLQPHILRIYMSGYTADVLKLPEGGLDDHELLQKPFTITQLAQRVRSVLGNAGTGSD